MRFLRMRSLGTAPGAGAVYEGAVPISARSDPISVSEVGGAAATRGS